jgi:hypothetical protein
MDGLHAVGLSGLYFKYSIKVHAENKTYASNKNRKATILSERVKIFYT